MSAASDRELPPLLEDAARLERTWAEQPGLVGWLTSVDHKSIGIRYLVTAFVMFLAGGVLAALMRLQLSRPENPLIGPDLYNQIFATHGTTMMFLFAVPVMQGLGIYLVPLMVGARNIAFPRLVAFSYWIYLAGCVFLYASFLMNTGPDLGWFEYPPLSEQIYTATRRPDVWAQLITFTEVGSLSVAVAIITTAFKMRAPGMSLDRVPIFVWAEVVTSFMVIFAMPAVMLASTALILDRLVSTHFFDVDRGGDALLFQHLFWFFGHPEVYIIFLPGTGIVSTLVGTFARRPVFGYLAIVLSLVSTAFIGFGLWVHHMFATGLPQLGASFFTAASIIVAIPTGLQFFCWIGTFWNGVPTIRTPSLWLFGFFSVFLLGGLTGVMLGAEALNSQIHDTYFVVAHLHYVLIGGAVFPLFAAIYYWFPKITGRMLSERLGKWQFWIFFIVVNLTFFPLHVLGLAGMPRRIYTYGPETGWGFLSFLSAAGQVINDVSMLIFVWNVVHSLLKGARAPADPWGGGTLEWSASSPPPACNFLALPVVASREPLWVPATEVTHVAGLSAEIREGLTTTVIDALPDTRYAYPEPEIWPFVAAVAVTVWLVWSVWSVPGFAWGLIPPAIAFIAWYWPDKKESIKEVTWETAP